jgi:hypothetical protein
MRWPNQSSVPERNPLTRAVHRREVFWQIIFPSIIGAVLILALAVGAGLVSSNTASQAANISAIWLILPAFSFTFIITLVLATVTYGLIRLIGILPPYAALVQNFFAAVNQKVRKVSDQAAEPVIKAASARARLNALFGRKPAGRVKDVS